MTLLFEIGSLSTALRRWKVIQSTVRTFSITQTTHRKPKWLGRAPSKEGIYFEKPKPTPRDLERGELAYKAYNEMLRSIAAAFQEELLVKGEGSIGNTDTFDEQAHHEKCMQYNDACNAEMSRKREERLVEILQRQDDIVRDKELKYEHDLSLKLKKYEDEVLEALSEYENWITIENLEDKILESMDNIVNYNFAVNRTGKIQTRTLMP